MASKLSERDENLAPGEDHLPSFTHRHFWDIDPTKLVVGEYPVYVMERLLEYGDLEAVRWLLRRFSPDELVNVLRHTRRVSPFSANFWAIYFDLDREEVRCLSKQFQSERSGTWRY
jgi:hypothetical protein